MIEPPKNQSEYPDRHIDCQEAMEPGFQAIVECMVEAGWNRGEVMKALRRLIGADNMAQEETAKLETELALLRALQRAALS